MAQDNMNKFLKVILVALKLSVVNGKDTLDAFLSDIISEWQLRLPTIVAGDDLPGLCMTSERLLCLSNAVDLNELAEQLALLHLNRKQDGVIFLRGEGEQELLENVTRLAPTIWTSNCPVFMPLEYFNNINLRLDSNIIFYEEQGPEGYRLVDIFAVKGGLPMKIEIGIWVYLEEITFQSEKNRWKRRNDLRGATFVNGIINNGGFTQLIKDDTGKVVGSSGYFQEMLFYITERLNLNIIIREIPKERWRQLENGSWTGGIGILQRKEADICSVGMGMKLERSTAVGFTLPTHRDIITLIAPSTEGISIDMWAYLEIFGVYQWLIFIALLVSFIIINTLFNMSPESSQTSRLSSALNATMTAFMFVIQMGDHSKVKSPGKRILTLTTSMLALLMFVYYTTDIIAKMTSGPPSIHVKSFEDVIQNGYKVITQSSYYASFLADAPPGSAKNQVYDEIMREDTSPALKLISEPRILWFTELSALVPNPRMAFNERAAYQEVTPLKMDDESYSYGTLALQKDSEFLEIFNYYIMKQYENGILKRLYRTYHSELLAREQFSMSEPQPLGYEKVVFPFTCLVIGVAASMWIAIVEIVIRHMGWNGANNPEARSIHDSQDKSCPEKTTHLDHDRLDIIEVIRDTIEDLRKTIRGEGVEEAIQRLMRLYAQLEGCGRYIVPWEERVSPQTDIPGGERSGASNLDARIVGEIHAM